MRLLALIGRSFEDELRSRQDLDGMDAEPALAGLSVRDLPRLMRERTESDYQQDRMLAAVIRCYRRRPTGAWSALLLTTLAPVLTAVADHLPPAPRHVREHDLLQQVVLEAVNVVVSMELPAPPLHLQRRIALRVATRTVEWLAEAPPESGIERPAICGRRSDGPPIPARRGHMILARGRSRPYSSRSRAARRCRPASS